MRRIHFLALVLAGIATLHAQNNTATPRFKVLAFYTGKEDLDEGAWKILEDRWLDR